MTAYVTQDDVFEATLTVRETVLFSARLRLPAVMNQEERQLMTDQMIESLGLSHCEDTEIGSVTTKKISGGERRRVAIACELVTNPSLVFLDEPTSGLDSENALRLVASLHRIAHEEGRSVVMSIHQPGAAMLQYFDSVIVLRCGVFFLFIRSRLMFLSKPRSTSVFGNSGAAGARLCRQGSRHSWRRASESRGNGNHCVRAHVAG